MKRIIALALVCIVALISLVACGGGIDDDQAKAFINDFFEAIVAEDYTKAESFLHPERPAELEPFFANVEAEGNVDFQEGISVERYSGVSISFYDSTVGGSSYELIIETLVGEKPMKFTIEIVQNDAGYGIYNLKVND